ncbi:MAG: Rrf2 family transcriptional regulator [Oscillospiraceae bacterium]|jgi:Rrf2 family protein|nr:Rrf2 family transcriptional regulator [Oscillospiraceae bacterium]MCI1990123.1 Rrf2 family transcriptional regulator [Oscillospiraceae bacterium]MCI2034502.1 Rrf2 family transcriptional regulator [Oscillospiraceae bacterium]
MRISSKGRYGLAAAITMAQNYASGACMTVVSLSKRLGISKIYLEQVFSLLKKANLVNSVKGAQGGYRLARPPQDIHALEILTALEQSLFEKTEKSVSEKASDIEKAMQDSVFSKIDRAVAEVLSDISLYDLAMKAEEYRENESYMFYI